MNEQNVLKQSSGVLAYFSRVSRRNAIVVDKQELIDPVGNVEVY